MRGMALYMQANHARAARLSLLGVVESRSSAALMMLYDTDSG